MAETDTPSDMPEGIPDGAGPNRARLDAVTRMLRPLFWALSPRLEGLDSIPHKGPALFVGNHTMIFMADFTIMMLELFRKRGIMLWSVGDHFHYKVPFWRDVLWNNGAIDGTYENCKKVLEAGQMMVVFPGGAREVTKGRGDQYKLLWHGRRGFARLAIDAQAAVVPFAAVGGDEIFDVIVDGDTIMKTPAGKQADRLFRRFGMNVEGYLPPMIKGMGPTMIPRVQRLYYQFGPTLSPTSFAGRADDADACEEFRDEIADAVESNMRIAFKLRQEDEGRTFPARLIRSTRSYLDTVGVATDLDPALEAERGDHASSPDVTEE